jgi:hypothetical protein
MTEAEWLACEDPDPVLEFLRGKVSERKLRLFFCACCRGQRYNSRSEELAAIAVAEAFADGMAEEAVRADTEQLMQFLIPEGEIWSPYSLITWSLHKPFGGSYPLDYVMTWAIPSVIDAHPISSDEVRSILRDIFGNPFRPVTLNPSCFTSIVLALAQQMYDSRDFSPMPILADALQDAGYENEEILNHCRQPGEHVRGCFVVNLLIGKT